MTIMIDAKLALLLRVFTEPLRWTLNTFSPITQLNYSFLTGNKSSLTVVSKDIRNAFLYDIFEDVYIDQPHK